MMSLIATSSPFARGTNRTRQVMLHVILATMPGLAVLTLWFGWGNLINVAWCVLVALTCEVTLCFLRKRSISFVLGDLSGVLTAVLIGLALPPLAPWWVSLTATFFAIVVAKQLYGGLGNNPFNPAMVGYALVLVSFPVMMTTTWAKAIGISHAPDFISTLQMIFSHFSVDQIDAFTMATPLDTYKHEIAHNTAEVVRAHATFGKGVAAGWQWVNLAFLLGGLYLLWRRIITWHAPVGMLAGLSLMSLIFGWDEDVYTPLSIHLLAGATMLGAFFIVTDPVTGPASPFGRWVYGFCAGLLLFIIRTWGSYPDAVAFSVLLMNFAAPFIDYYTQPRTYGHAKASRGIKGAKSD